MKNAPKIIPKKVANPDGWIQQEGLERR